MMRRLFLLLFAAVILFASCQKKCRCWRYDGNVDEFTNEELDEKGTSCSYLEQKDFGQYYSLCEKVSF